MQTHRPHGRVRGLVALSAVVVALLSPAASAAPVFAESAPGAADALRTRTTGLALGDVEHSQIVPGADHEMSLVAASSDINDDAEGFTAARHEVEVLAQPVTGACPRVDSIATKPATTYRC